MTIPITHVGQYTWTEPLNPAQGRAKSFVAETQVEGSASVGVVHARPFDTQNGPVFKVEFRVTSFSPGAALRILSVRAGA